MTENMYAPRGKDAFLYLHYLNQLRPTFPAITISLSSVKKKVFLPLRLMQVMQSGVSLLTAAKHFTAIHPVKFK